MGDASTRRLAELFPLQSWRKEVLSFIEEAPSKEPWGIACSGGADSVALLLCIHAHFPQKRSLLNVLHFNHQLRGQDSVDDAQWVKNLAERLGLYFYSGSWKRDIRTKINEAEARRARHTFFRKKLFAMGGRVIFLAHHRGDIAEQMLMRLARGSGLNGLTAPRPVQIFSDGRVYLRPLLDWDKTAILQKLSLIS